MKRALVALLLLTGALALGCDGDSNSSIYPYLDAGVATCPVGTYACPCSMNGFCEDGLVCVADRCDQPFQDVTAEEDIVEIPDAPEGPDVPEVVPDVPEIPDVPEEDVPPPPVCDPACPAPESICVQGDCLCAGGYHEDGAGGCTPNGACAEGYAIPNGNDDCVPIEDVCTAQEVCRVVAGWEAGQCAFDLAPDGALCEKDDAHRCAASTVCETGDCVDVWPGCASAPRPIVFVHDRNGVGEDLDYFVDKLVADGWNGLQIYHLLARDPIGGCNTQNAADLATLVEDIHEDTCAARVDIVAHGMGGLAARYYLKLLGGTEFVNVFVSLGTPHDGLEDICWTILPNCAEEELCRTDEFIAAISAAPATPGDLSWVSIYSDSDAETPTDSAHLEGAENILLQGLSHGGGPDGLLGNEELYTELKRVLSYDCP